MPIADSSWALVQYQTPTLSTARLGVLAEGKVHDVPPGLSGLTLVGLLGDWNVFESTLRTLEPADLAVVPDAELVAPLTYPAKVLCAGANYYSHAAEMGTDPPSAGSSPFFFLKPPTTTIVGPYTEVTLPSEDADVDWEAELAVVLARGGRNIDEDVALDHVAGYVVANDLSARGLFHRDDAVFPAFAWDWLSHKSYDGFLPLGPGMVPHWLVEDPQRLAIRLSVNGVTKQDASTSDMVVGVAPLIAAASRIVTLEPGDVILTGTPAGVGMPRKTFLAAGDVVRVEIDGIGRIENRMVAP